jgi:hypothetical protein
VGYLPTKKPPAACYRLAAEQCLDWPNCTNTSPAFAYVNKVCQDAHSWLKYPAIVQYALYKDSVVRKQVEYLQSLTMKK